MQQFNPLDHVPASYEPALHYFGAILRPNGEVEVTLVCTPSTGGRVYVTRTADSILEALREIFADEEDPAVFDEIVPLLMEKII